eukprot:7700561-Pyramimonas_sp.AAC.1
MYGLIISGRSSLNTFVECFSTVSVCFCRSSSALMFFSTSAADAAEISSHNQNTRICKSRAGERGTQVGSEFAAACPCTLRMCETLATAP